LELNLGPDVPDAEIEPLRNLNQLKYLNLSGAELTDAALRPPSDLPHLQDLWITIDNFSGDGLRHLSKLTQLQELHIASSSETANINLEHLARLPQLRLLDIRCKNWDRQSESKERGSLHLAKMDTLENLVIQGDLRVDDANLDVLADCPRLKQLGIEDNRLTDASIPHLKKLSRIEAMAILSTRISETGAAELKKVQPDAYIDIKGGGPGMF
jgi:Leucine-rich repeat (LRR) protein